MKALKWMFASVLFSFSMAVYAGQSGGIVITHYETLQRLSVQAENTAIRQMLLESAPLSMSFDALGRSFDFRLQPYSGFLSEASRNSLPAGIGIYRGELAGNPDSWARIVIYDGSPRGLVWDGQELFAIEAPGDSAVKTNLPVIYRFADTYIEPGSMTCGADSLSGNGAALYGRLVGELSKSQAAGAVKEIDIGAVGDYEFTSGQGGDAAAAAAIATRLAMVDGIYSQEIGVQINVPLIETYNDPNDPFSDETDASTFLDEVVTYRSDTPAQDALGLTHLWTGRSLDGTTVGIAYNDVLCRSGFGAGLSEGNDTAAFDSLIAAHEIGHNFGAPHDGTPGLCESEPQTFIMAPMLNGSNQFSDCSKTIMEASAAAAACVVALPAVDVSIDLNGQSQTVLLSQTPTLVFDVRSNGTVQVANVVADITLPNNLSIDSVSPSSGSCNTNASNINCDLGNIPGLTVYTVTVNTTAATVGAGMIDATVTTTDTDERLVNNQYSQALNVDPAVDLVINSPSTVSVTLDQSATIRATLENRAILDATGVTLSISFGNGVRADSATWSIGNCTVAAQQVDCTAASFANQSNTMLTIGVTGMSTGVQNYSATMSSNEADANPSNNNVNGTVTVSDPPQESSGGAAGLPFLCLLGLTALIRRRKRNAA